MPTRATRLVVGAAADRPQQLRREARAGRQLGHRVMPFFDVIGMMPGDDRHLDAGQFAALAEVVEVAVVEEQLRADVVGPGVHLAP